MDALQEDIAKIRDGLSPRCYIQDRAFRMGAHARAGDDARAEELAAEIALLQAEFLPPFGRIPEGASLWLRQPALWADILFHGWMVPRDFFAPADAEAATAAHWALQHLSYNPGRPLTARDVRPAYPAKRVMEAA